MKLQNNESVIEGRRVDDVRLSESLSLIGVLAKKLNVITNEYMTDDVPKSMKLVLQCLINRDGVTQLDIVKFTGFKAPTISIMIQKMESLGYVRRQPDPFDLRAMRVFITDEGKKIYTESAKAVKMIEGKVLRGISSEEKEAMVSAMRKIEKNLESF